MGSSVFPRRLKVLQEINKSVKVIPSTLDFYDIAGLVKVIEHFRFVPSPLLCIYVVRYSCSSPLVLSGVLFFLVAVFA